ncbi:hypothetical protein NE865_12586 [Phthorimaea operculella]|nr:hypothetical protein NE865_12586 [Phthorimaea operculella]
MFRFLLLTTLLALSKSEDAAFFQGEWTQVAFFASAKGMVELTCLKATFEVTHEPCHERANFDVVMKLNGKNVFAEPNIAIIAQTKQEVENALNDGCKDGKNDLFTVHRDLTSNYRMLYVRNCRQTDSTWNLLAKQAPTQAALEEFVNSNEELKDKFRAFLCTSEVLQNPPSKPTRVEMTKPGN